MRCGKADSCQRCFPTDGIKQSGKVIPFVSIAIGVDILAKQSNLPITGSNKLLNFYDDRPDGLAAFTTAGKRHNAIGTPIVATPHDGNKGAGRALPHRFNTFVGFGRVELE